MNILATAPASHQAPTPVATIRAAAEYIRQHGHPADGGPTVTAALTYAAGGDRAELAAALTGLQKAWNCPLATWERIHFGDHADGYDDAWALAWHLDMAAKQLAAREKAATCPDSQVNRLRATLAGAA